MRKRLTTGTLNAASTVLSDAECIVHGNCLAGTREEDGLELVVSKTLSDFRERSRKQRPRECAARQDIP
jgi:hypothetical protein